MSTISSSSSTSTSAASAAAAAQAAAAQAQLDLQEVGQSLISSSTGNTTIDPTTLVSDLVTAKIAGQQAALETRAANDETQISAIGQLSAALSQLQVDLGPLSSGQLMNTFTASASGSGVTATAGTGAAAASYSLYVQQVAQAQSLTSGAISTTNTASMGTGTLTLSLGSQSMTLNVTSGNNSLSDIVSAINSATGNPGISASIVTGSDGSHLVLASTLTGANNTIGVSVSSNATGEIANLGVKSVSTTNGVGALATAVSADNDYLSGAVASADAAGTSNNAAGTLTIAVGSSSMSITPTSTSESLSALAQQINAASGSGTNPTVTATVVTDGSGNQFLQVTSPNSSSSAPVTVSASSGSTGVIADVATAFTTAPTSTASPAGSDYGASEILTTGTSNVGWTQTTAAQNAYFTINGTPATSALNTVQNALSGITLSLSSAAVGTTQTLTVAADTTTMSGDISQFVSDYNSLVSTISTLTAFDSSNPSSSGPLIGDSMVQQINSSFGTIVGSMVKGSGVTSTLAALGITLNSDGTLTLDSSTLSNVLQSNPSQVAAVFNSTNGIGQQLNAQISSFTDSGGTISVRNTQLSSDLTSISTQSTQLTSYAQQLTSMYTNEFTSLNNVMSTSYTESQYLTDLFGGAQGGGAINKSS